MRDEVGGYWGELEELGGERWSARFWLVRYDGQIGLYYMTLSIQTIQVYFIFLE